MSQFKPFRELMVFGPDENGECQIVDAFDTSYGSSADRLYADRLVECWNACRKIAFPTAHISASAERAERLESLRKEAWATAEKLLVTATLIKGSQFDDVA